MKVKRNMSLMLAIVMATALVMSACGSTPASSAAPVSSAAPAGSSAPAAYVPDGIVPTEVKIFGGTTGGSWNIATTIIGNFLPNDIPGIRCTVSPGAALSNVAGIQSGDITLAVSKAPTTFDGYNGVEPFTEKTAKVMNMGFLYNEHTHIIVNADSGINSIADLKGKRLTTFAKGNTAEVITRDLLSVYDMTYDDLAKVSFSNLNDMGEQFKDGLTDALCFASATPVSVVMDIASVRNIKLLEIPDDKMAAMQKISPSYMRNIIPAGTYKGVDYETKTMGNAQHLIVSSDLDTEFVYKMTKSIVEHLKEIGEGHAVYAALTPELMAQDLNMPMHPGAAKYYKEIGVMK